MKNKKVRHIKEKIEVDYSSGEVTKHEYETVSKVDSEPPYVKFYIEDISRIWNIPDSAKGLLYNLLPLLDFNGYISLNKYYKDIICKQLEISDKTFRNNLLRLTKSNILRAVARGMYEANPALFAKGAWKDIKKRREDFRLIIDYKYNGERTISTEFVEESDSLE